MILAMELAPGKISPETLRTLPALFSQKGETIHQARNHVKVIELDGILTVVKSFRPPNLFRRVGYALRGTTKAQISYENALRLLELNIDTPEPLAYLVMKKEGKLLSYYLSRRYEYDFTLKPVLRDPSFPHREEILQSFGRFVALLHQKGIWHRDLSQGNLLIRKTLKGWSFALVDLNRIRFAPVSPKLGPKNFGKLWTDQETLRIILTTYALDQKIDIHQALHQAISADRLTKRAKILRRRLQGKPIPSQGALR